MRDMQQIRESFEREREALEADVVLVVTETFHPPCSYHSSHEETFGVFANPNALERRLADVGRRRRASMSARVRKFHE